MTYHVHSLHVRSVKVTSGTYTLDGQTRIPSPPPLHEAEKFGDAADRSPQLMKKNSTCEQAQKMAARQCDTL